VQFAPNWISTFYGTPPVGHNEEQLEVLFYHLNSRKDLAVPVLKD
jgi:hypothetical protein